MRAFLPLLAAAALLPAFAAAQESVTLQRYLENLYLGDALDDIRKVYKPLREWPSHIEPRGRVTRFRVDQGAAKGLPAAVAAMWLGMKRGRLVEMQFLYTAAYTRQKPVEALVDDLALIYGEPRSTDGKFWWADGKTVLRVFYTEVPVLRRGAQETELRTSLQLLEAGLFKRTD